MKEQGTGLQEILPSQPSEEVHSQKPRDTI